MKKITTFLLIVFVFVLNSYAQSEKYYVTATQLNVRQEPVINDKNIITKLNKGSEVYVIKFDKEWAEIKIKSDKYSTGFVSSKYLSKEKPIINAKQIEKEKTKKNGINWIFWGVLIVVIIIIISIIINRFDRRCEKCGKWGALKTIKTEIIDEKPSHIKKTLKKEVKDRQGKVVRVETKEITVPATKFTYKVYRKCKHCGHIETHIKTETKEN